MTVVRRVLLIGACLAGATCIVVSCQRDHQNPFDPRHDPFDLRAIEGEAQIELRWDVLPTSPVLDGVAVERTEQGQGSDTFSGIDSVAVQDTSYVDYGVTPSVGYAYRVRAFRAGVFSEASDEVTATATSLRPPTGLVARDYPDDLGGAILLEWVAAPADSNGSSVVRFYHVYRSLQELTGYSLIDSTAAGTTTLADSVLDRITYYYRVAAKGVQAVSSWSEPAASAQCSSNATPTAPPWLEATDAPNDQGTAVDLQWGLSPDDIAGVPTFQGYSVFRSDDAPEEYMLVEEVDKGVSSFQDTTALPGLWCYYRVRSRGGGGALSQGAADDSVLTVDEVAPEPPTDLLAADTPDDQGGSITLSWVLSADDQSGAGDVARYAIFRSDTDQPESADSVGAVGAGVSEFVDEAATSGQEFYYWVRAWDSTNPSDAVGPAVATAADNLSPSPPPTVTAQDNPGDGGGAIALGWDPSPDDGPSGDVAEYRLYRRDEGGSYGGTPLLVVAAGTTSAVDTSVVDSLSYYYVIRAWDGTNLSDPSTEAGPAQSADDLPPGPITDLATEGGPGEGDVTVSWTAPAEDSLSGGPVEDYDLRYSESPIQSDQDFAGADEVQGEPVPGEPGADESLAVGGFQSGVLYYFAIRSTDDVGLTSAVSNVDSATPGGDDTAPAAVGDLLALPGRDEGEIVVSWTAPGDDGTGGGPAAEYDLRYDTVPFGNEGFDQADTVPGVPAPGQPGGIDSVTIVGLEGEERYYFRIKTRDDAGNWSEISNLADAQALGDTIPPATVTDLVAATGAQENEVILTWTAPGDDGMTGTAMKYYIRYSADQIVDASDWSNAIPIPEGQITPPLPGESPETLLVTAYLPEDIAWFALRAEDDAGNMSAISNTDSTVIQGDITAPETITTLVVSTGDNEGDVRLTWDAPHEDGDEGGAVEEYEIRHHDTVITGVNWANATLVTNPPDPLPPGQTHTLTVGALTPGKLYYFAIKSADEVPNWSAVSNSDSAYSRPDVDAPDSVLDFTAVAGETSVQLSWQNPADWDFQGVELRFSTESFPDQPWEGTFIDLVWGGPNELKTYVHTAGIVPKSTHYYAAFAFDDAYPDPNYSVAAHDSATPGDFDPPGSVTEFTATGQDTAVRLTWTNPSDSDVQGTVVRYSTTEYPADPEAGFLVVNEPGAAGQSESYIHGGLENGQVHYYAAFAYDDALPEPNYSEAQQDTATPLDTTPPASVTSFEAEVTAADTVRLAWQNPTDADFEGTRICFDTSDYPGSPDDGTVLIDLPGSPGGAEVTYHADVASGLTYYYAAFAYDEVPNYADAAQASAEVP